MTGRRAPTHLVVGPPRHGVVTFALDLADTLTRSHRYARVVRIEDWSRLAGAHDQLGFTDGVHLNFTDRLFGETPRDAANRIVDLVDRFARKDIRVTATLHDVPQPADGGNYVERIRAYRTVVGAVHGCATNSAHEQSLLGENGIAAPTDVIVVPLPLDIDGTRPSPPSPEPCSVAVLGFVYPGKGHADVIEAMADLALDATFVAVGQCSPGHDDLAERLAERAEMAGVAFAITGYLPTHALPAALQRVSVPVAAHRHVSASGSLNTWIAAHRRPLVPTNRYTVEHVARHPGTARLYPDTRHGLAEAIDAALADPESTWLAADAATGSTSADAARRYADAFARWHD